MPVPVSVPKLGNRMRAGLVAEWYQPDGAPVHAGEPVCRVECDFVAVEIEADSTGTLRHRLDAGLIRPPGDLLGVILAHGERVPQFAPVEDEHFTAALVEEDPPVDTSLVPPEGAVELVPGDWELPESPPPVAEVVFEPPPPQVDAHVETPESDPTTAEQPAENDTYEAEMDLAMARFEQGDDEDLPPAVAFPRRFASFELEPQTTSDLWAAIPGDDQSFESGLFPVPRDAITEAHVGPRTAGDDDQEAASPEVEAFAAWLETEPEAAAPAAEPSDRTWALARPVAGQVITMSTTVALTEALKMRDQLTREWRTQGLRPALEDIALRAVARALMDLPGEPEGTVSLSHVVDGVEEVMALHGAAYRPFRDAVNALPEGESAHIGCIVTSYLDTAIESATPRLLQGHRIAVALGAERQVPGWTGDFVPTPVSVLSIAFEPASIADAEAGRFIARIRELMESPYALLAD